MKKKLKKCPLCACEVYRKLFKPRGDFYHNIEGDFQLCECSKCKAIFLNPQPSEDEVVKYYPINYYSYNAQYKVKYSNILGIIHKGFKTFIQPKLKRTKPDLKPNKRLLDIGCGNGDFLLQLREIYPEAELFGTDIGLTEENIETLKINNIIAYKEIDLRKFKENYFDYVCLNHVFEHLHDPEGTLEEIQRILKIGGEIIIGTPNTNSLQYKIFRKFWVALEVPRHIIIYNPKNIQLILKGKKVKFKNVRYYSDPYSFLGSLEYILNNFRTKKVFLEDSKIIHNKILIAIFILPSIILNKIHYSDAMEIFITK